MKVDFYILDIEQGQRAMRFACQLLEKAYAQAQTVYVHTRSKQEAEQIDNLLWTYRDDSFIPHALIRENKADELSPPIQIGYTEIAPPSHDSLMNFADQVPTFYTQFEHVVEIVFSDSLVQQLARERFKHYRSDGCDITTHKIKASEL